VPENSESGYGWNNADEPNSGTYVTPCVIAILRQLGVNRVLDVGSGNGSLCSRLYSAGFSVVGVEQDLNGIQIARNTYPEIPFYQAEVQDAPSKLLSREGLFDAVVSTEVIEHLYSPHQLPQCAYLVLRPGGHLILSTPYHGYIKNLAISILNSWDKHHNPLWHGGHIKFWSKKTLSKLLKLEGFSVVEFHGVGRAPLLWKSMIITAIKI
jgi:2-polyprenyl-3-methyl-5-hydroxy-6-metoxy-1,4-benzoquinol methylase